MSNGGGVRGERRLLNFKTGLKLGIFQKGLVIVLLPLVFELVFVVILLSQLQEVEKQVRQEVRAKEILAVSSKNFSSRAE